MPAFEIRISRCVSRSLIRLEIADIPSWDERSHGKLEVSVQLRRSIERLEAEGDYANAVPPDSLPSLFNLFSASEMASDLRPQT